MEVIRVRLMPKQPKRDGRIDQRCMSYRTRETGHERGKEEGLVLMIPEVKEVVEIPFYHPPVRKLAFRYETIPIPPDESATVDECTSSEEPPVKGRISIAYLPFDTPPPPTDEHLEIPTLPSRPARGPRNRSPLAGPPLAQGEDTAGRTPPPAVILASDGSMPEDEAAKRDTAVTEERLHRTCLGLLERVYKHGYGRMVGYRKRVKHDVCFLCAIWFLLTDLCQVIVSRDSFQDLYLILKDRHRHLDSRAPKPGSSKIEDVKRHVFKVSRPSLSIAQLADGVRIRAYHPTLLFPIIWRNGDHRMSLLRLS